MTTYNEWRVTGRWQRVNREVACHFRSEDEARAWAARRSVWTDGPHVQRRVVALGEWQDAGPPPVNRPHPTCIDVTGIDQQPRGVWACRPECPKEA